MKNILAGAKTYDETVNRFTTHVGDLEYQETFHNGMTISVIRHQWSYGNKQGLYEVAIIDALGEMLFIPSVGDSVIGYCTAERVVELALTVWRVGK